MCTAVIQDDLLVTNAVETVCIVARRYQVTELPVVNACWAVCGNERVASHHLCRCCCAAVCATAAEHLRKLLEDY